MRTDLACALLVGALALTGCASTAPQAAFADVEAELADRTEARVVWRTGSDEDARADAAVAALLADSLTADDAVAVALLSNRRLQATYEDLGVSQAALVQAGLLRNPVFGARALWPVEGGGAPELGVNVAFDLLGVLTLPLRRSVAQADLAAARLRVAAAVLDLEAEARAAVVAAQAAEARFGIARRVEANAEAGYEAALVLREAGNTPAVDLLLEQARFEQVRLDLVAAEAEMMLAREALVRTLGVAGDDAGFALAGSLPPAPDTPLPVDGLEAAAVERSLALAAGRAEIEAAARRLGLATPETLVPDLEVGGEVERDDGEWKAGPEVEIALPLLDQGQARRAALRAELRRRQALYYATAVDVRSAARVLATRAEAARRRARHLATVVVPLRVEITQQTLRQYNAMQTGVFGLLDAQAREAEAALALVDARAAYWTARADLDGVRAGRLPAALGAMPAGGPSATPDRDADH